MPANVTDGNRSRSGRSERSHGSIRSPRFVRSASIAGSDVDELDVAPRLDPPQDVLPARSPSSSAGTRGSSRLGMITYRTSNRSKKVGSESLNRNSIGDESDHVGRVNPTPSTLWFSKIAYMGTWPILYWAPQFERIPA